jgi:hypothetical protein
MVLLFIDVKKFNKCNYMTFSCYSFFSKIKKGI